MGKIGHRRGVHRPTMSFRRVSSLLVAPFLAVACVAEPSDVEDDEAAESTSEAVSTRSCEIGRTCPSAMKLLEARSNARTLRPDAVFRYGNADWTMRTVRQSTTGVLRLANDATTLRLRGPNAGDPVSVDDVLLVEVLDTNGQRLDAVFAGGGGANVALKLGGTAVRRIGVDAYVQPAGAIDLTGVLPFGRAFKLRLSALDIGGAAYVSDVVAEVTSKTSTFTLSADGSGAAVFTVDDDIVVKADGVEVARGRNPQLLSFSARAGQTLDISLFDTIGGCFRSTEIWLSGGGLAPTRVVPEIANRCGTPANGTTPFYSVSFTLGQVPTLPPAPPVPPPPQECWAMYSNRSFACDAPRWTCHYPTTRQNGQWSSKAECLAARPSGLCSPNDCTSYTCSQIACP